MGLLLMWYCICVSYVLLEKCCAVHMTGCVGFIDWSCLVHSTARLVHHVQLVMC